MKIFISGLHSGPNPSPGLGVARSLRLAYPAAKLIGVDYSNRSSGIHHDVFNDIWLQPSWDLINLDLYRHQIEQNVEDDAIWISGLDLETIWLSQTITNDSNILIPSSTALLLTAKPFISAHKDLPISVPPFMTLSESDWSLHAFCRKFGWYVWLKGPYYEARRIRSWSDLEFARHELSATWSTDKLFLQSHIAGYEESIAFSAYKGVLLDSVYMNKRDITAEGKTWSGSISNVSSEWYELLEKVVADLNWTGGSEIECVRDGANQLWVIDWNPRFPAWIYGATLAGRNLPAKLVERSTNCTPINTTYISSEYTRVVLEIPTRKLFPLPTLIESSLSTFGWQSKHPSGMPLLAKHIQNTHVNDGDIRIDELDKTILEDLMDINVSVVETPIHIILKKKAHSIFTSVKSLIDGIQSNSSLLISIAYSVKTNPNPFLVRLAYETGMLIEVISQLELEYATKMGFNLDQIILNGPAKYWPKSASLSIRPLASLKVIFCDSVSELNKLDQDGSWPSIIGVRLRPPLINSRFGIPIDDLNAYSDLVHRLSKTPPVCKIAIHFHFASNVLGTDRWMELFDSMLTWSRKLEQHSQHPIYCLDIGGGWFPDDWNDVLLPQLKILIRQAKNSLPNLQEIIMEPGKALVQPTGVVITRVVDIRQLDEQYREVVVDAAISDLPDLSSHPHRILVEDEILGWKVLPRGNDRILGRICMETDVIARNVHLPADIKEGAVLIICDTGAYDRSMSYDFGRGYTGEF